MIKNMGRSLVLGKNLLKYLLTVFDECDVDSKVPIECKSDGGSLLLKLVCQVSRVCRLQLVGRRGGGVVGHHDGWEDAVCKGDQAPAHFFNHLRSHRHAPSVALVFPATTAAAAAAVAVL